MTNESTTVTVTGSLNSAASTAYRVEFFANSAADASGNGEGKTYLGYADVTTDSGGDVNFNAPLSATIAVGEFISANKCYN